ARRMFMLLTFTCGRYSYALSRIGRQLERRDPPLPTAGTRLGDRRNHSRLLLFLAGCARLSHLEAHGLSGSKRDEDLLREELHSAVGELPAAPAFLIDRELRVRGISPPRTRAPRGRASPPRRRSPRLRRIRRGTQARQGPRGVRRLHGAARRPVGGLKPRS